MPKNIGGVAFWKKLYKCVSQQLVVAVLYAFISTPKNAKITYFRGFTLKAQKSLKQPSDVAQLRL